MGVAQIAMGVAQNEMGVRTCATPIWRELPSDGGAHRWGCAQMGVRPSDEEACLKNQQFPSLDSGKLLTSGFFLLITGLQKNNVGPSFSPPAHVLFYRIKKEKSLTQSTQVQKASLLLKR